MRRLIKVLGATGALSVLACGGVAWWFAEPAVAFVDTLVSMFEEPEWAELPDESAVLLYLLAHADDVSVYVESVDEDGMGVVGTQLVLNQHTPRVLASTMKIVVLSAYVRAIDEGVLTEDASVALGDWDSWYLPGLDGGAHPSAYERLDIDHHDGAATDPTRTVPLSDVVSAMMEESDNAATDVLIERLGARIAAETAGMHHSPIGSLLADTLEALGDGDPCVARQPVDVSDPQQRRALIEAGTRSYGLPEQRRRLACVMPRGTAADYAMWMSRILRGKQISPEASARMAAVLDWPMDFPSNQEAFHTFGAKGGSVPGVLIDAAYAIPKSGDFAGQGRVVVVMMNEMSGTAWVTMMGSFVQQRFARKLATDQAFVEEVRAAFAML